MFENRDYVYAVYQEKSFSRAAKKMYITQPCLSAMVKKEEQRIGAPIFNRNVNPIQLTEYGKKYIDYVIKIRQMEQELESYLSDIRGLKNGTLLIGANNMCSSFVLPSIMNTFSQKYPAIHIELHEGNIAYLNEQMQKGHIDIILDNYPVDERIYQTTELCTENLFIGVPENLCPLLAKQNITGYAAQEIISPSGQLTTTDFKNFAQLPFIVLRKGNDTRSRFDALCQESLISANITLEVDQLSTAFNISASGLGVTLVSDTLLKNMPAAVPLRFYPINSPLTQRQLFFHYPKNKYLSVAMKTFMALASEMIN